MRRAVSNEAWRDGPSTTATATSCLGPVASLRGNVDIAFCQKNGNKISNFAPK
jgi:hypothetical protein